MNDLYFIYYKKFLIMEQGPIIETIESELLSLAKRNISVSEYLKILQKYGKIEYLSCNEFCERIKTIVTEEEDTPLFIQYFQQQFSRKWKSQKRQINYKFPFVKENCNFSKVTLERFMTQYMHYDAFQEDESIVDNTRKRNKSMENFSNIKETPLNRSINLEDKKDGLSKIKKIPVKGIKDRIQSYEQTEIPKYFLQKEKALITLLCLDFSSYFQSELSQVKNLIKSQIKNKKITMFFEEFLIEYMQYKYILDGKDEKVLFGSRQQRNLMKETLIKIWDQFLSRKQEEMEEVKVQEHKDEKENKTHQKMQKKEDGRKIILEKWRLIYQNLSEKSRSGKFICNSINKILQDGVESIYLVFKLKLGGKRIYGVTNMMTISINVNIHSDMTLQQFRQGPLKPYIALTVYHELAHYLLRGYEQAQVDSSRFSFSIKTQSIGAQILKIAQQLYKNIPSYLKLSPPKRSLKYNNSRQIQKTISKILQFISKSQQFFIQLRKYTSQLDALKGKIQIISPIVKKILINVDKSWQQESENQKIRELYAYIDRLLSQDHVNTFVQIDETKQFKYKLFFSAFLIPKIVKSCLSYPNNDEKIYFEKHKQIRGKTIQNYYLEDNPIIEEFSRQVIKEDIQQQRQIDEQFRLEKQFIKLILDQKCQIAQINQSVNKIVDQIDSQKVETLCGSFACKLARSDIKSIFPAFHLPNEQQKIQKNAFDDNENIYVFQQLCDIKQLDEMLRNFVRYQHFLLICYQIPTFFTHDTYIGSSGDGGVKKSQEGQEWSRGNCNQNKSKHKQSGYDIERRMFPTLVKTEAIYAKDWKLMQDISNQQSRKQIGETPLLIADIKSSVSVSRQGKFLNKLSLKGRQCGNQRYALTKEQKMKIYQRYDYFQCESETKNIQQPEEKKQ